MLLCRQGGGGSIARRDNGGSIAGRDNGGSIAGRDDGGSIAGRDGEAGIARGDTTTAIVCSVEDFGVADFITCDSILAGSTEAFDDIVT